MTGLVAVVNGMKTEHGSLIGRCVEKIEEHVEEACSTRGATGGTPERKRYPRPEGFRCGWLPDIVFIFVFGGDCAAAALARVGHHLQSYTRHRLSTRGFRHFAFFLLFYE